MAIPGRREAAALLLELSPTHSFLAHAGAVAEVAAFLAARISARGRRLDQRLVEASGLLHDVDKLLPRNDPRRAFGHGLGSARWLAEHGYAELGEPVAAHPVSRLADDAAFAQLMAGPLESRVVAYADKRASRRLEPMAVRFARWRRRHPDDQGYLDAAWPRALRLETDVCAAAGMPPTDVRRLRWVRRALRSLEIPGVHAGAA